jgi:hypothetical protein
MGLARIEHTTQAEVSDLQVGAAELTGEPGQAVACKQSSKHNELNALKRQPMVGE